VLCAAVDDGAARRASRSHLAGIVGARAGRAAAGRPVDQWWTRAGPTAG